MSRRDEKIHELDIIRDKVRRCISCDVSSDGNNMRAPRHATATPCSRTTKG